MDFEVLKKYLFNLPESRLEFPQGPDTMVYKVMGKGFAFVSWQSNPIFVTLKCDPKKAIEIRKKYPGVMPGYHMNQTHWNTLYLDNEYIPDELFLQWVHESYQSVIQELPGFLKNRILKKIAKANE